MDRFHVITISIASITLIVSLVISAILLFHNKRSQKFPPDHSKCPDRWVHSKVGDVDKCTPPTDQVNAGDPAITGVKELDKDPCKNKGWAESNNIYWDGLTTYNGC